LGTGSKAVIKQIKRRCRASEPGKCNGLRDGQDRGRRTSSRYLSPEQLCRGGTAVGLDLPGFQAVTIAAAEGRDCGGGSSNAFVEARGLWTAARFSRVLSAEAICRVAEACATGMGDSRPLVVRLHACRALGLLSR
ncbi:unnamed protein product, partial [Sphacelaria rigidula]